MEVATLTVRGVKFLVPCTHMDAILKRRWHLSNGYAVSARGPLHTFIAELEGWDLTDKVVDHINGDIRDNRVENLRPATTQQNAWNSRMNRNNTSGYRGVSYDCDRDTWNAYISVNRKKRKIGRFKTKEAASAAYEKAAQRLFGEFYRPPAYIRIDTSWQDTLTPPLPSSGPRGGGVTWDKYHEKWIARGYLGSKDGKKYKHLGRFDSKEEAVNARKAWELQRATPGVPGTPDSVLLTSQSAC